MCSPRSPHLLVTRYGFCADMYLYIARAKRDAWDMAAEICLTQLPTLLEDPNADLQLDHGSEHKKQPEQLPIVLQVWLFAWSLLDAEP
ncbi:hypothetical protein RHMOL_Rhmol01G0098100 [Rhododendron molle]|uniref:Uncharacterized protein n=1 Tax=Rhododendron molle TaxID=49168 RepID=A0ACC0Q169_RHOML|nr:hypothetical protein RHMOL_Rhmol01G0098100 [Rhododendron molle]